MINNIKLLRKLFSIPVKILKYIFFISFGFVILYPFIYMFFGGFMSHSDYMNPMVEWIPRNWSWENIGAALYMLHLPNPKVYVSFFESSLMNTLVLQICAGMLQFCSCAVAAYGLARFKFKGRRILNVAMILNILVPNMMLMVPNYVNYSALGLTNSLLAFWIPSMLGVGIKGGLFIYIYSQFYRSLPKELEEAAWIDGASSIRTFLSIVVPTSGSVTITVLLFSIVWHWNEYFTSNMYAPEKPVLSAVLYQANYYSVFEYFGGSQSTATANFKSILLMSCLIVLIPLIIFYCVIQRKFVASIATSGIVG